MSSFKLVVRIVLLAAVICFGGYRLIHAQDSGPVQIVNTNSQNHPQVEIGVSVLDQVGKPAVGLTDKDFEILEDDKPVTLKSVKGVTDENIPLAVALVIDVSTSMSGAPLESAKAAAIGFVDQLRDIDEVSLVVFSSKATQLIPMTKDKASVKARIKTLTSGGETALYDAISEAVKTAQTSTAKRRAIVLLTDGAEFGGLSKTGRNEAYQIAAKAGIPVTTIGLGYGMDEPYLRQVAQNTGGQFYPSPKPTDLAKIYSSLATLLRSQYVLTYDTMLPADGSTHKIEVRVKAVNSSGIANVRYPAPIPVVKLGGIDPKTPLAKPGAVTAVVVADNKLTDYTYSLDGKSAATGTGDPKPLPINPITLVPGKHSVALSVNDDKGHVGKGSLDFQVAALPPEFTIDGLKTGETLSADRKITVNVTASQTPVNSVIISIDGKPLANATSAPFAVTFAILKLDPGKHQLTVQVKNNDATGEQTIDFTVAPEPRQTATQQSIIQATRSAAQTLTAQPTKTLTPTRTPTSAATNTAIPLPTDTPRPVSTNTPAPTNEVVVLPSSTSIPTNTATPAPTNTPAPSSTYTNTPLPSNTPLPTSTSTNTPSNTPSITPTITNTPSNTPTLTLTPSNTPLPTSTPSITPTNTPVPTPTPIPPLAGLTNFASSPVGLLCIGAVLLLLIVVLMLLFGGRRGRR